MLTNIKLHLNLLSIPGVPLAARYNWCQGLVPGRGPAVEKHCYTCTACRLKICGCCFLITKIFNVTKKILIGARSLAFFFFWNTLYLNKKNPRPSTTPIYTLLTHESVQENTKINLSLTSNYNSKTEGRAERRIISFNDSVNWRYCRASMLDE